MMDIETTSINGYDDLMMKFIRLMHLKKALMPWEYDNLGLKHLDELRQEVEILEQKMIDESKK